MNSVVSHSAASQRSSAEKNAVDGEFVEFEGERFYAIHNVDRIDPFFISMVSNDDHWLFASSTGGLTVGRVSPETALFPYVTVDKLHESGVYSGCKTVFRVHTADRARIWEPFNSHHDGRFAVSRNVAKNVLGNKLRFEEINYDLGLAFRYTWQTSETYGFVRSCELQNLGTSPVKVDLVDGLQNVLPAGTPLFAQTNTSNLVDAYKWTELDEQTGLALFTLYSGITDRAEPCESLKANTAFCLGLDDQTILLSSRQISDFRQGQKIEQENHKRGIRGAFLVNTSLELDPKSSQHWQIVANIEQDQAEVVDLRRQLRNPTEIRAAIAGSIESGSDKLARIMAGGDGFQATAEENVSVHHYANVLFNILRGGVFDDQYFVSSRDFAATVRHFNLDVFERSRELLDNLPTRLSFGELLATVREQGDPQLERLSYEYLPITFGRRHGDPSRPWNQFAIRLKDEHGNPSLSYQGNWRDIFQNWEAMLFSYPEFVENVIAKFVNASTVDGYNPYRITKEGIDWEVEEPDNPWSYIGYWGDHQIIYLQKLLELSRDYHPGRLRQLLHEPIFSYANVPYRIRPFDQLLEDPKNTVDFDNEMANQIDERVAAIGADGKMLLDSNGDVYRVTLLEKLLVPLLGKLSNLVIDGGIWMNTQRPEWNDANNALVGQGLSIVTLCYIRRYVTFLQQLLADEAGTAVLSGEVGQWLQDIAVAIRETRQMLHDGTVSAAQRYESLAELGQAASRYRQAVYQQGSFSDKVTQPMGPIMALLDDSLVAIDHTVASNRRSDGLYHAYNLLDLQHDSIRVNTLYPMLEGQVAALSAGSISPDEAVQIIEALFDSEIFRPGQKSFMLYPDRKLPGFLDRNRISTEQFETIPLLTRMLAAGDERIVLKDADGGYRFSAEFRNVGDLNAELDVLVADYGDEIDVARPPLQALYESVFDHASFTGRSGTMFGFEGLGSIYWHMVSKLLLAILENFFSAIEAGADYGVCNRLGQLYYQTREGLGFNKTPAEYGAFPTDPYSHTPKHSGARQPGMTGQVKEEILSRFGELGIRVSNGEVRFQPALLRIREFITGDSTSFRYLDVHENWCQLTVPPNGLAFTWCQVPIVYKVADDMDPSLLVEFDDGTELNLKRLMLAATESAELFTRSGRIRQIAVTLNTNMLLIE